MSQTAYTQDPAVAVEGLLYDLSPRNDIVSGIATEAIPFGRAVAYVTGGLASERPPHLALTAVAADVNTGIFVGITRNEVTLEDPGGYAINAAVSVLRAGRIWVLAEDAVTFGGKVFARITADTRPIGRLRSDGDTGEAIEIPGALWRSTTGGADEYAVVELNPTTV